MREVDQDVVVMYTLVKFFLMFLRVIRVYEDIEGLEGFYMVLVIFIWRNSNISLTRALPCKPRLDSELAISITLEYTYF